LLGPALRAVQREGAASGARGVLPTLAAALLSCLSTSAAGVNAGLDGLETAAVVA
jgi:hypothetical protein